MLLTGDPPPEAADATDPVELGRAGERPGLLASSNSASPSRPEGAASTSGLVDDVWLQPRDPSSWVAHWSANPARRARVEEELGRGRWWLRLRETSPGGRVVAERPATEHEGSVVVHVEAPGRSCVAELGYDAFQSGWHPVVATHAPAPSMEPLTTREGGDAKESPSVTAAAAPASWEGDVPGDAPHEVTTLPAEVRRTWQAWAMDGNADSGAWATPGEVGSAGSLQVAMQRPWVGQGPGGAPSSAAWGVPGNVAGDVVGEAASGPRAFRFAVHAEVIIHGSTEPDARVTVGGRPVALRPDGSFSLRWILPDGDFRVPAVAVARDGRDRREARLRLLRSTTTEGGVGVHGLEGGAEGSIDGWAG
ncbi:MAG: hypothetical protein WCR07_06125 [Verrucomicrobiota bacterium]|jgi:hypothetical protein